MGGISTPKGYPYVFLFTGASGAVFGYDDKFQDDGTFWYTGEGQVGDMTIKAGNKGIASHSETQKSLLLFENLSGGRVRFVGESRYLGHHIERRPDREGDERDAIVFELELLTAEDEEVEEPEVEMPTSTNLRLWSRSLADLRKLALKHPSKSTGKANRRKIIYQRSEAVKVYVLRRAKGVCECCGADAPFKTKIRDYLEAHHIDRVSDGGPDRPGHVGACCPNCHREIHFGVNGEAINEKLRAKVAAKESCA